MGYPVEYTNKIIIKILALYKEIYELDLEEFFKLQGNYIF